MPTQANLIGSGNSALCAQASIGILTNNFAVNGSGTNGVAPIIRTDFVIATTTGGSGNCSLPDNTTSQWNIGDTIIFVNHSGATANVYPFTAAGKIANGSAGASVAVSSTKTAWFLCLGSNNWGYSTSA